MDSVAVTFDFRPRERAVIADALGETAAPVFIADLDATGRAAALKGAAAVLARNTNQELQDEEAALLGSARLLQFMTAGIDFVKLGRLPAGVPVASNGGAYAAAMAEHALGMVLAGAKRLIVEHQALTRGEFNQFTRNRVLAGGTCGIIGFGGIGEASARLFRALGMKIVAINRRGASAEPTDWIGTMKDIDTLLAASDVVIVSTPLTPQTNGMIGARELAAMKPDAILVNLARGEVVQEDALYAHLVAHPGFIACIDAWWVEPERHGSFRMDHPFMTLANVVGSPHNSASVPGQTEAAIRRAVANIRRALNGETPLYTLAPHERMG
ncbi:MAG TPA: NAD(P)-dependent oxidoreductase [Rhodopila sp.]|uniref:NAD(P)-dependent oxidoreductase n=1 Tax=Rhodopila sp. TaxID=2480087 RepID=UPI002C2CA8F3|nr:NAD(P)-dependent oxidoreductase [Rhodopila sp.]HVY17696.1 NAD(P)-dependent oxidoreductase [Rhodopila sp.]